MTNEEAIVRINNLIKLIKSPRTILPYCPEEMEALNLAIKALEERPQGECCGSCYLCDVGDCKADLQKGGAE